MMLMVSILLSLEVHELVGKPVLEIMFVVSKNELRQSLRM
jgi:hypothetical protein